MATSIDFEALMKAERKKAMEKRLRESTSSIAQKLSGETPLATKSIEGYRVGHLKSVFYIPNWVTKSEEEELISSVQKCSQDGTKPWANLPQRRLQNWGGVPHDRGMIVEEMPSFLGAILSRMTSDNIFEDTPPPNHVLLNEYVGEHGISPHKDGPLYHPRAAILSLGNSVRLDFLKNIGTSKEITTENVVESLLLMPGSLLVFADSAYNDYWHGIASRPVDVVDETISNLNDCDITAPSVIRRGYRLSVTVRAARVGESVALMTDEQKNERKRRETQWLSNISEKRSDMVSW
jgi:alkylated DNA repair protein alkB homolog 6